MSRPAAYQPQSGPPPRQQPLARSGMAASSTPLDGFPFVPTDHETPIYLRSPGLASDSNPSVTRPLEWALRGNDDNAGASKTSPLLTPWGVLNRFGRRAEEGERFVVKMAGGLTEAEVTAGVDPWDGQCSSMRQYPTRGFTCDGGEAYVNNFRWEGPLKGVLRQAQTVTTLANEAPPTGRTKWRYFGAPPTKGDYLRVMRGGLKVTFEMQITEIGAEYFYTDNGNYAGTGVFDPLTDTFHIIYRACEFIPTSRPGGVDAGVGGADGISLTGFGTANMRGRLTNGLNPAANFTMLGFENLNMRDCHGLSFDRCVVYHQWIAYDSSFELRGCQSNCQAPTVFVNCSVNVQSDRALETAEYRGHAEVEGGPAPLGNPINPQIGGQGLFLATELAGGGLRVEGGRYDPRTGLSADGGVVLRFGARFIMNQVGQADMVHLRYCPLAGQAGLKVLDDSVAYLYPNNVTTLDVNKDFIVGTGAGINKGAAGTVGSFLETAGWNGNFSRHLEVNGAGKPTGDHSAIRTVELWDPIP